MSAVTNCHGLSSRSTQTDQVKSKVLNVSLLILKNGEFDDLAVKVVKKKNNKESVVITYSNLFGILGEDMDPVSITLSCDGVCRVFILFCSVLSHHLVSKGTFDAASFLSILRRYQKNTVFCPGIPSSIIPILPKELVQELTQHEHPFRRHQARNCMVFFQKSIDKSKITGHCKDCNLFLVKLTRKMSSHSKLQSCFKISDSCRVETTADVEENQGKLQQYSDVFRCKKLVKLTNKLKIEVNDNTIQSAELKLSEGQSMAIESNKSLKYGHVAINKNETCSIARKDQNVPFIDSDMTCTSKRLDQIIFHLEEAVTKSKKRTSFQSMNKSHTRYQNTKLNTVRKLRQIPLKSSSRPNCSPHFLKSMSTLSNSEEMPTSETGAIFKPSSNTVQIPPIGNKTIGTPTTAILSVATSKTGGKTLGKGKPKRSFTIEPVYKVSFPNAEGRNVCIKHIMSSKGLPKDQDIPTCKNEDASETQVMSRSGQRSEQVEVKSLADFAKHRPAFATGKVQDGRGRKKGLAAAQCPVCLEFYSSERTLKRHLRIHNLVRPYTCPVCGKAFVQKITMKVHMRLHSGEKPHQCFICARSFAQKSNMETHVRRHLGVRPFKCEQCSKSFSDRGSLGEHKKTHTGEQPYLCTVCGKCFSQRANMRTHMNRHHAVKMYSCGECSKTFKSKESLKKHRRNHVDTVP